MKHGLGASLMELGREGVQVTVRQATVHPLQEEKLR